MKNYYEILGLTKDATDEEIKSAYKKLALKYHPDKNQGKEKEAEEKIKEINEAYGVLGNPEKREEYDNPRPQFSFFEEGLQDFLDNLVGNLFTEETKTTKGETIAAVVELTLEEILTGVTKKVKYNRLELCPDCFGVGAKMGDYEICEDCRGTGTAVYRDPYTFSVIRCACSNCKGTGNYINKPCSNCKGLGRVKAEKEININIPKSITEYDEMVMPNFGNEKLNSIAGDLVIRFVEKKHPIFTRQGLDLYTTYPLSIGVAILGGEVEFKLLDGKTIKLKIDEGTQPGKIIRLRDKGLSSETEVGSLFITLTVFIPNKLMNLQKEQIKQLCSQKNFLPTETDIENITNKK